MLNEATGFLLISTHKIDVLQKSGGAMAPPATPVSPALFFSKVFSSRNSKIYKHGGAWYGIITTIHLTFLESLQHGR